jgi:hypothetical protein
MNFGNDFYSVVSSLISMETFSNLLTIAVSGIPAIQPAQTKDSMEKWGVSDDYHEYGYGRHLYYRKQNVIIPFWVGLNITRDYTQVTIVFERATLNALLPQNKISSLSGKHSEFPKYCNPQRSSLLERQLVQTEFTQLCNSEDPQILADFLNEVLGTL